MATLHVIGKEAFLIEDCGAVVNVSGNVGSTKTENRVDWTENESWGKNHIARVQKMWDAKQKATDKVAAS